MPCPIKTPWSTPSAGPRRRRSSRPSSPRPSPLRTLVADDVPPAVRSRDVILRRCSRVDAGARASGVFRSSEASSVATSSSSRTTTGRRRARQVADSFGEHLGSPCAQARARGFERTCLISDTSFSTPARKMRTIAASPGEFLSDVGTKEALRAQSCSAHEAHLSRSPRPSHGRIACRWPPVYEVVG